MNMHAPPSQNYHVAPLHTATMSDGKSIKALTFLATLPCPVQLHDGVLGLVVVGLVGAEAEAGAEAHPQVTH